MQSFGDPAEKTNELPIIFYVLFYGEKNYLALLCIKLEPLGVFIVLAFSLVTMVERRRDKIEF